MNLEGCRCQAFPNIEYDPESNEERQIIQQLFQQPEQQDDINIFINNHDMSIYDQDTRKTLDILYDQLDFDINNSITNVADYMINDDQLKFQGKQETFMNPEYKKQLEEEEKKKKKELKLKKISKEGKTVKSSTSSSTKKTTSKTTKTKTKDVQQKQQDKDVQVEQKIENEKIQTQEKQQQTEQQLPIVEQKLPEKSVIKEQTQNNMIQEQDEPERRPERSILINQESKENIIQQIPDKTQQLHITDFVPEKKQQKQQVEQKQEITKVKLIPSPVQKQVQEKLADSIKKIEEDQKKQKELIKTQNLQLSTAKVQKQVKFDQQEQQTKQLTNSSNNGKNKFNIQKIENQLIVTLNNEVVYQSNIDQLELIFNEKTNQITFGAYRQTFTKDMYKKIKEILQTLQKQSAKKQDNKKNIKQMIYIDDYDSISVFNAKKRVEQTLSLANAQEIQTQRYIIYKQPTGESICLKKTE